MCCRCALNNLVLQVEKMGLLTGSRLGSERTVDLDALEVLGLAPFDGKKSCSIRVQSSASVYLDVLFVYNYQRRVPQERTFPQHR